MVVLLDPFGPIRPKTSFSTRLNDMLSTATRPPKRFVTPAAVRASAPETLSIVVFPPIQQVPHRSGRGAESALNRARDRSSEVYAAVPYILDQPSEAVRNH